MLSSEYDTLPNSIRLRDGIYAAWSNDEIIILDARKDKYFGLNPEISKSLIQLLNSDSIEENRESAVNVSNKNNPLLLIDDILLNFVELAPQSSRKSQQISIPLEPGGLTICQWRPQESLFNNIPAKISFSILFEAIITIIQVERLLYKRRLAGLIEKLDYYSSSPSRIRFSEDQKLFLIPVLHKSIQRARMWYPRLVDCLIGSGALALMLLRRKIKAQFVIGVQKYPFYAHAWVEHQGIVINDSSEVNKRLSILLRKPSFNKIEKT